VIEKDAEVRDVRTKVAADDMTGQRDRSAHSRLKREQAASKVRSLRALDVSDQPASDPDRDSVVVDGVVVLGDQNGLDGRTDPAGAPSSGEYPECFLTI
jgi:hypothetical protein